MGRARSLNGLGPLEGLFPSVEALSGAEKTLFFLGAEGDRTREVVRYYVFLTDYLHLLIIIGSDCAAIGSGCTAFGWSCTALGSDFTAFGSSCTALSSGCTAFGSGCTVFWLRLHRFWLRSHRFFFRATYLPSVCIRL